jgi:hypothetical protein
VRFLLGWLELAGIASGPLFRSIDRYGQVQARRRAGLASASPIPRTVTFDTSLFPTQASEYFSFFPIALH